MHRWVGMPCVGTVPIFGHNGGIQMKDFTILNFLTLTFKIREILQIGHVFQKFINEPWNEYTITWNNAPYIDRYISQTWVPAPPPGTQLPGIPVTWDVTSAVAEYYQTGNPVNLVLYSSDNWLHSGKYFISSNTGDWIGYARPTITVVWSN